MWPLRAEGGVISLAAGLVGESASVVAELERRGEVWSAAPGVIGLRGDTLALYRTIEARIASLARGLAADEWLVPPAVSLDTLARADYFASFPQWLTLASHLTDDETALERVASAPEPARAIAGATQAPRAALPPAVCYHTYAALADRTLDRAVAMTAQCTCWRHEGVRTASLERGWAFTMRESVVVGNAAEVRALRSAGERAARTLAGTLGLDASIAEATDPFFAPTARGRTLLQQIKALKQELVVPIGGRRTLAIASFNDHESFFGQAFGIRTADGAPASTGCVAFGLERWLLAFLCAHGPDARAWPSPD